MTVYCYCYCLVNLTVGFATVQDHARKRDAITSVGLEPRQSSGGNPRLQEDRVESSRREEGAEEEGTARRLGGQFWSSGGQWRRR